MGSRDQSGWSFPKQRRNYWKEMSQSGRTAVENFSPQMFIICMGTGILAVQMKNNPYQFRGLDVISIVVWLIDLILFFLILGTFLSRWIIFPSSTAKMFSSDVEQTTYLSTTSIAVSTLVELLCLECGSTWRNWQYACYALWWLNVVLAVIAPLTTYWLLIRDEEVHISNLSPTLMYPTTGIVATASAGSVLMNYTPISVELAMPVLIVSYMLLGAGFFLGILTITAFFIRLLSNQTPPPKKVAAQMIPVATLANAAYSFTTLGYLAGPKRQILNQYGKGPVAVLDIGQAFYAAGFVISITIFGFATFWLFLATIAYARDSRRTVFNLNMWSAAYPVGVYGIACSQLSIDLDSTAFRYISTIVLVVSVLYWLFLLTYTLPSVLSGELFLKEVLEKQKKDEEEHEHSEQGRESGESV